MSVVEEPAVEPAAPAKAGWRLPGWQGLCRRARLLLLLSVLWLLYVAAQWLISGRWWVWALADLLPPLAFLVVPLLLLAAVPLAGLARRWVAVAAVAALALGTGLAGLNLRALTSGDGPAPPGAIRVLSWNTAVWDRSDDPARFYGFLRDQRADVYLLQEYDPLRDGGTPPNGNPGTAAQMAADVATDLAELRRNFPGYTVIQHGELVTLTRLPVVSSTVLPAAEPGANWREDYRQSKTLRLDVQVGGRLMSIYNVHIPIQIGLGPSAFSSATRHRFDDRRKQYRALTDDVAGNRNPLLVAGDFNTSPSMGELRPLRSRLQDAIRADGALLPTSWPVGVRLLPRLWRLDWALVTPSVAVHDYVRLDARGMSDHRADRLTISLRGSR